LKKGENPIDSTTTVKVPGGTFVTIKFPTLSVVAPLNGFVSPCLNKVMVAYSIGWFEEESTTVPVYLSFGIGLFFCLRLGSGKYE
jgi:hypothetical protein